MRIKCALLIALTVISSSMAADHDASFFLDFTKSHNLADVPSALTNGSMVAEKYLIIDRFVSLEIKLPRDTIVKGLFRCVDGSVNDKHQIEYLNLRSRACTAEEARDLASRYLAIFKFDDHFKDKLDKWLKERQASPRSRVVLELIDNNKPRPIPSISIRDSFDADKPWLVFLLLYFDEDPIGGGKL
jgi:hypothetical protein